MATLLHLDSALTRENSVSRAVTATFREAWETEHPQGTVRYRDLAAEALPHIGADAYTAGFVPTAEQTPEQRASFALREELITEFEQADAVLIGAPLYNYNIPSTLKAWLDHVVLIGRTSGEGSTVAGKPVTVVTSRGGSYRPGTPREGADFAVPYLRHTLGQLGLEPEFIVPELTLAYTVPAMAELVGAADASRAQAENEAVTAGRKTAAQLAAG